MELKKIILYYFEAKLKSTFRTSFGSLLVRPVILVKVEERSGEIGWGEVVAGEGPWYSYETYETAILVLKKYIVPRILKYGDIKAKDVRYVLKSIRGHNMAKTGVEEALWDLESRLAGEPLYRYIGGVRDEIVAGVSIGLKPTIENLMEEVKLRVEEGYRRIKIKIEPGRDVELVKAIRKEFPDIPLQVDANAAYTLNDINVFRELDKYELLMIEQPLAYDDLVDHSLLSRKISTPICLDESIVSISDLKATYLLGSAEIVNIKPGRVGGIESSRKMLKYAGVVGMGAWIGGMLETGVGRAFLVALASLPEVNYPNDISASERYWDKDIVEPPWELTNKGTIRVLKAPGIGVEVLEEEVEKRAREVWETTI